MKNSSKTAIGTGIITAIASSLCCITPVLALISGSSGAASSFSWMEPFRPYLLVITILVLGFAWFQKLKPIKKEICETDCCTAEKKSFFHSKKFLGIITIFSAAMMLFPYYSSVFYDDNSKQIVITDSSLIQEHVFKIEGMTCEGCQEHINHAVNELEGIISVRSSYKKGNTAVKFDQMQVNLQEITIAINSTGYKVI